MLPSNCSSLIRLSTFYCAIFAELFVQSFLSLNIGIRCRLSRCEHISYLWCNLCNLSNRWFKSSQALSALNIVPMYVLQEGLLGCEIFLWNMLIRCASCATNMCKVSNWLLGSDIVTGNTSKCNRRRDCQSDVGRYSEMSRCLLVSQLHLVGTSDRYCFRLLPRADARTFDTCWHWLLDHSPADQLDDPGEKDKRVPGKLVIVGLLSAYWKRFIVELVRN